MGLFELPPTLSLLRDSISATLTSVWKLLKMPVAVGRGQNLHYQIR